MESESTIGVSHPLITPQVAATDLDVSIAKSDFQSSLASTITPLQSSGELSPNTGSSTTLMIEAKPSVKSSQLQVSEAGKEETSQTDNINAHRYVSLQSENKSPAKKAEPVKGWPNRRPFSTYSSQNSLDEKEWIYATEMTWKEKQAYRKSFLKEYLSEMAKSIPYTKRFLATIYRISPWRVVAMIALNIVRGLLPAVGLQTRGRFIHMVCKQRYDS